jgi:hypothetical protein
MIAGYSAVGRGSARRVGLKADQYVSVKTQRI